LLKYGRHYIPCSINVNGEEAEIYERPVMGKNHARDTRHYSWDVCWRCHGDAGALG